MVGFLGPDGVGKTTLLKMLSGSLPLIVMFIWTGLAEDGPVGGYSAADFLTVFFVRQMTVVWVIWALDQQIRRGELSPRLLRPPDPFGAHVAVALAWAIRVNQQYGFALLAFWFVKVGNTGELFNALVQAGRFPVSAFPAWARLLLTAVVRSPSSPPCPP